MIITCPNCNKKFKIDNSLVPEDGRDLQCGSCDHTWFYKKDEINEILELREEVSSIETETKVNDKKSDIIIEKNNTNLKERKNKKITKDQKKITTSKNRGSKFFSYLIVFIISFFALVILLDTLKSPLINVFPVLEVILFSLFETLQDIKLFIIDLI